MTEAQSILLGDNAAANTLPLPWDLVDEQEFTRWLSSEDSNKLLISLSVTQRIAGALSVLGGLYIFTRAWKRRQGAFDRIMMGKKKFKCESLCKLNWESKHCTVNQILTTFLCFQDSHFILYCGGFIIYGEPPLFRKGHRVSMVPGALQSRVRFRDFCFKYPWWFHFTTFF